LIDPNKKIANPHNFITLQFYLRSYDRRYNHSPANNTARSEKKKSIFVYKHVSNKQVLKNKILLQQNLISLLQKGEKIIHYADKTTIVNNSQFAILSGGSCLFTEKLSAESSIIIYLYLSCYLYIREDKGNKKNNSFLNCFFCE